jgi:hypothetical protein
VCSLRIRRAEKFPDRLLHTSTIGIAAITSGERCCKATQKNAAGASDPGLVSRIFICGTISRLLAREVAHLKINNH